MDERHPGGWRSRLALYRTPLRAVTARRTSGPQHAAPGRFSRRALWAVGAAVWVFVVVTLGAVVLSLRVGSSANQPAAAAATPVTSLSWRALSPTPAESPSASPAGSPSPSRRTTTAIPAGTQICGLTNNGGSFYLYVSSATAHNFAACAGGTRYGGTIDQLMSSGVERRCTLGADHGTRNQAIVSVYSGAARADRAAARAFCSTNGGSDSG